MLEQDKSPTPSTAILDFVVYPTVRFQCLCRQRMLNITPKYLERPTTIATCDACGQKYLVHWNTNDMSKVRVETI